MESGNSLLRVCRYDYERESTAAEHCAATIKKLSDFSSSEGPPLNPELERALIDNTIANKYLHLEIESYYLFAKILLDKIAHAVEYYFGKGRGVSLDSHDDLVKKLPGYAGQKSLIISDEFIKTATLLKKAISDYRDYEIAHEKSPRRITGTALSVDGRATLFSTSLYPTAKDVQVNSTNVKELMIQIEVFIQAVIGVLKENRDRTALPLNA